MSSSDIQQVHDRRTFLRRGAMGAGALWTVSLQELMARTAVDQTIAAASPYGPVAPRVDQTTGLPLLQLPEGFSYFSYGWNGDRMSDGIRTPPLHDGMAVVDLYNGNPDLSCWCATMKWTASARRTSTSRRSLTPPTAAAARPT